MTFKRLVVVFLVLILPTIMSYSRPGVAAAVRLSSTMDKNVWRRVVKEYQPMLLKKKGEELVAMDAWCEKLSAELQKESSCISKSDLIKIIEWKFAKGRPRPYMKMIKANSDEKVKSCSKAAFSEAQEGNIDTFFDEITKLQGVGIAGASAILSLRRPDLVAFMDDEVIETLFTGKRAYTRAIFDIMNEKCTEIAEFLGEEWTPRLVGKALWTAARISACGAEDPTLVDENKTESTSIRKTKRRKT
jgi:hypothetical protein